MPKLPWRVLLLWTLLGVGLCVGWVLTDLSQTQSTLGALVDTGPDTKPAQIIGPELGPTALLPGGSHDGQQYYIMARDPWHPSATAPYLDTPWYRLIRVGFPVLVWTLNRGGTGWGLVWTMFAIGVVSLVAGGLGMGALSVTLGGKPWLAVVFPLLLGSITSLRISVPDPLALALVLWAVVAYLRGRFPAALALAIAAVLTKEISLFILAGLWVWRRDRQTFVLTAVPAALVGIWALWVRTQIPAAQFVSGAFTIPFQGAYQSVRFWAQGYEPLGLTACVLALGLGIVAMIKRGWRHPLGPIVAIQLGLYLVYAIDVIGPERNATRTSMALVAFAAVMLATPRAAALHPPPGQRLHDQPAAA